ncbi:hypothetical protein F5J12DRAFT_929114, partial [Pisolithus orientalis]|uniref:uncharacterized protein n=1 Tax=Pisolithus orientalis TaxID=936130 RepID=UPI002225A116
MVSTTQPSFVAEPGGPNPCVDNTERCKEQEEVDIKGFLHRNHIEFTLVAWSSQKVPTDRYANGQHWSTQALLKGS